MINYKEVALFIVQWTTNPLLIRYTIAIFVILNGAAFHHTLRINKDSNLYGLTVIMRL